MESFFLSMRASRLVEGVKLKNSLGTGSAPIGNCGKCKVCVP